MPSRDEIPPQRPKTYDEMVAAGEDGFDDPAIRALAKEGKEILDSGEFDTETPELSGAAEHVASHEVGPEPQPVGPPEGKTYDELIAEGDDEDMQEESVQAILRGMKDKEIPVRSEAPSNSAEALLSEALAASPFEAMEDDEVMPGHIKQMVIPVRLAYLTSAFNYWNGTLGKNAYDKAQREYNKALQHMRRELDTLGNLPPEYLEALIESFVAEDEERLAAIKAAILPAEKQVRALSIIDKIKKAGKHWRGAILAAFAAFFTLTSDVPSRGPHLPTEQPVAGAERIPERRPAPTPEAVREAPQPVSVEVSAQGANETFYRFFRLLRAQDPETYERLSAFAGPDARLIDVAEHFAQRTQFWRLGIGEDISAVVGKGDTVSVGPDGEIIYTTRAGATHWLTINSKPQIQTWLRY